MGEPLERSFYGKNKEEIMWFKKEEKKNDWVKVPDRVTELKENFDNINKERVETEDKLKKEIEKLHRIIKFSNNEPTYNLTTKYFWGHPTDHTLYIYCDKEEYIIKLLELGNLEIDKKSCEFRVEDNLAYFNVLSYFTCEGEKTLCKNHDFIIDFANDKYVYSCKEA